MTTNWVSPNHIIQFAETGAEQVDVSWDNSSEFKQIVTKDRRSLATTGQLVHIARSPKNDIKNKTYYLRCTDFKFDQLPNIISGIEVRVNVQRFGRAMDDTIQLCLDGKELGENQADTVLLLDKIYGSPTSLWGLETCTKQHVENLTFGVSLRYKAHPNWPHSSAVLIDSVEMRIH